METQHRYPGTSPFEEQDANIFFGRDRDIEELLRLIRLKELVVLYGKSGLGKTSLINAGVIPELTKINQDEEEEMKYVVMKIRFLAWRGRQSQSPLETFIEETVGQEYVNLLLEKANLELDSLWYGFKNHQLNHQNNVSYVLFFDQFEELFTYPIDQIEVFKKNLAQLLQTYIPTDYQKSLREKFRDNQLIFSREEKQQLLQAIPIRVVLSIRNDQLSLLDKISDYLPNILVNLYELKALDNLQAKAAIELPAIQQGSFSTPPFKYERAAISAILAHLESGSNYIEPFQIQYVCEHAEQIVKTTNITTLGIADLGDLSKLFENYYYNKIAEIDNPTDKKQARNLLEDGLLFNGIRLSLLKEQIISPQGFSISLDLLKKLEDVRLIRAESRGGQTYYEITHDTLIKPISATKEKRKAKEWQQAKEKKRRHLFLKIFISFMSLFLLVFLINKYKSYNTSGKMASKFLMSKIQELLSKENPRLALRLTQEALKYNPQNIEAKNTLTTISPYLANFHENTFTTIDSNQFSTDNNYFLFYSDIKNNRGTLHLLNLQNLQKNVFADIQIYQHQYSPNNEHLVFHSKNIDNENNLLLLNLKSLIKDTISDYNYYTENYSSDSKYLTFYTDIKGEKGNLHVLNLIDLEEQCFLNCYFNKHSFSPDNKYLAFYTQKNTENDILHVLRLKDLEEKTFLNRFNYQHKFSPDSKYLTFYTDIKDNIGTFHLLSLQSSKEEKFTSYYDTYSNSYSPDSKYVVFYTDVVNYKGNLNLLNLDSMTIKTFSNNNIYNYSYSTDSKYFMVIKSDSTGQMLHVLNLSTLQETVFSDQYNYRNNFRYSSDNHLVSFYTNTNNIHTLHMLDLQTLKKRTFPVSGEYHYSPDSKHFIFYKKNRALHILNLSTLQETIFSDQDNYQNDYKYCSDNRLVSFYNNTKDIHTLHVLDLQTLKKRTFPISDEYHYSPNGKHMVFYTNLEYNKGTLRLINLQNKNDKEAVFFFSYTGHKFSQNNKYLAFLIKKRKTLTVVNLNTKQEIKTIQHQTPIIDFQFSKDSRYLISTSKYPGSENGVLKITDLHIEGDLLEYYDDFYAPLTKEERERYGLE